MIKIIVDTQLPPRLVQWLSAQGYSATHPYFLPPGQEMTDREILEYATTEDCIIITKDRDFFDYYLVKGVPPRVLLLQFGNIRNQDLMSQFNAHIAVIAREFEQGVELLLFDFNKITRY